MLAFAFAPENMAFAIALGIMFAIAVVEGAGTLLGFGFSTVLDSLSPDFDLDVDMGDGGSIDSSSGLTQLLGWLHLDKVPVLVILVVFLTSFGLTGYGVQAVTWSSVHFFLPMVVASLLAAAVSLPITRFIAGIIATLMPRDETAAVSSESLVGRVATIVTGTASASGPAEARVKDQFGKTHYVMVKPDSEEEVFEQGAQVLLVKKEGAVFLGISETGSDLLEGSE